MTAAVVLIALLLLVLGVNTLWELLKGPPNP